DNIGRWAAKNGMVGVTMQRHPGTEWDDGGKDISTMIQWLQANITRYKGNPDRMFIWAHSAGNGPLGIYIGHPEIHGPKGVGVKGAIFMSGNPVQGLGAPAGGAGRGGAADRGGAAAGGPGGARGGGGIFPATSVCGIAATSTEGAISGPSGAL